VVEQQRTGHLAGIGIAVGIAGRKYSWHRMVVQIAYAEETVDCKYSQDCVLSMAHLGNSYDLSNHQAGVESSRKNFLREFAMIKLIGVAMRGQRV
jgi:hypothetical protein